MLADLYGWTVVGTIITVLIGIGVGVLSMNPPHYHLGQVFISLAAALLIARGAWWIVFEQYSIASWQRVSFIVVLFGGVGLLWGESLHWLQTLQLSRTQSTGIATGVSVTVGKREPSVVVSGLASDKPHIPGSVFGSIKWQELYIDTRINIENPNDFDLEKFDVTIEMDLLIQTIGQISSFPGVSFFSGPKADLRFQDEKGRITPLETSPVIRHQYRVHADRLLKRTTLQLVVAALPNTNPAVGGKLPDKLFDERRVPDWASVNGEYYVGDEKHTVQTRISFEPVVHQDEAQLRAALLERLRREYILSHDNLSSALLAGTEQPPALWINARLKELGESWHISAPKPAKSDRPIVTLMYQEQQVRIYNNGKAAINFWTFAYGDKRLPIEQESRVIAPGFYYYLFADGLEQKIGSALQNGQSGTLQCRIYMTAEDSVKYTAKCLLLGKKDADGKLVIHTQTIGVVDGWIDAM